MLRNWALALRPSLSLDFLAGLNDSRITYSGGANGTRIDSSGVIVAATTPRFDYDPVTLAARGLLVEEARTNLVTQSRDLNASPWLRGASLSNFFTVTTDALLGPDGVGGVAKFVTGATTAEGLFARLALSLPAATYAVAPYIYVPAQAGVTNWSLLVDAQDTGDFGQSATSTTFGQWVRAPLSLTTTGTRTFADFNIRYNGAAPTNGDGFTFYVCCAQIEAGSFPTSYIPTTSASVTRTADSAVMTGTNFSDWYNESQGTFLVQYTTYAADTGVNRGILAVDDGSNNNRVALFTPLGAAPLTVSARVVSGGSATNPASQGSIAINSTAKAAVTYGVGTAAAALCVNAATPNTANPIAAPVGVAVLRIGEIFGVTQLGGHIQSITYYPRRLSNEQLQALTS